MFRKADTITNRDAAAKARYLSLNKEGRKEVCFMAPCNDHSCMGLMLDYQMRDFKKLKNIRQMKVTNRLDRIKRLCDYVNTMKRMIERSSR